MLWKHSARLASALVKVQGSLDVLPRSVERDLLWTTVA